MIATLRGVVTWCIFVFLWVAIFDCGGTRNHGCARLNRYLDSDLVRVDGGAK